MMEHQAMAADQASRRAFPRKDLTGQRFERLVAIEPVYRGREGWYWQCRCDCGNETVSKPSDLKRKKKQSCGCLQSELLQAFARSRRRHGAASRAKPQAEYHIWNDMIARCENPKNKGYADYGGRDIKVCRRWRHDFAAFLADVGPRPSPQHSIDRIDNNGNYELGNVKWSTRKEQDLNRRTTRWIECRGKRLPLKAWAEYVGRHPKTIAFRLNLGFSPEKALFGPIKARRGKKMTPIVQALAGEGLSQREIARRTGFSHSTIGRLLGRHSH
jgi:hypothetical protein